MTNCSVVFPGQGSQQVGMGAELAREFPEAREVFEMADRVLGLPLSKLCWDGPEEELRQTEYAQPAIVATSLAAWRVLETRGMAPDVMAGHSVGEYTALTAAGCMTFEECMRLVRYRGQLMQQDGNARPGGMAALLGVSLEQAESLCRRIVNDGLGVLEVANLNAPDQIVISGEIGAIEAAEGVAKEFGARRYIKLPVSAAFHSSLMSTAATRLAARLDAVEFKQPRLPVVANVNAAIMVAPDEVRGALRQQLASRVRWADSVRTMLARGITTFVEVGPGTALVGMIRKIQRDARTLNVHDPASVQRAIDEISSNVAA